MLIKRIFLNEEQFILLAIKVLSGNHLPEESEKLRLQVAAHESYRSLFEKLSIYWKEGAPLAINEEAALGKVWGRIGNPPLTTSEHSGSQHVVNEWTATDFYRGQEAAVEITARKIGWRRLFAAAALIPLLALSIWLIMRHSLKTELVEKYNQKGIRSVITLSDGSKIWLNADSRLKYPTSFQAGLREVYLEGEAFFEIARNPQRPFVVHLPKGNVHVLGTSFDIRAYDDEEWMTTSVATGRVAFIPATGAVTSPAGGSAADGSAADGSAADGSAADGSAADSFYLTSERKAVYHFGSGVVNVGPTDAAADRDWINGVMAFNNESLGKIAVELERSFGKPIKFRNAAMAQYRYTATFKNNTEEEILSTLRRVKTFYYSVTDKFIEIK